MNGNGYDSATKPTAQFFNKEQRQRVEALTVARALRSNGASDQWIDMAAFIYSNTVVFRDAKELA